MSAGVWQNGLVASYRDRMNPELLRFPGLWRTRILIGAALLVNVLTALLCWWFETGVRRPWEAELVLLAGLSAWQLACWPREIICGPAGVEQRQWLGLRKVRIGWGDIRALEPCEEFGGAGKRFGLEAAAIRVVAEDREIRHSPRHPDPARFLAECRLRMEEWASKHARTEPPGRFRGPGREESAR